MEDTSARVYERQWSAEDYLRQFYAGSSVSGDEAANARFLARSLRALDRRWDCALEFGCGPTVHHAAPLVPYVGRIDMSDYLDDNLAQVQRWQLDENGAHDWDVYLADALAGEDGNATLNERKAALRARFGAFKRGDIRQHHPLGDDSRYGIVTSYYCAEAVATSHDEWRGFLANLSRLVAPGGVLILGAMRRCTQYHVFGTTFASAAIDEHDFARELPLLGFAPEDTEIAVVDGSGWGDQGFDSICCVRALRTA